MSARSRLTSAAVLCTCAALAEAQTQSSGWQVPASPAQVQPATRDFGHLTEPLTVDKGPVDPEGAPDVPPGDFDLRDGGDTCASATVIPSLPYTDTGTTVGKANNYDSGIVTGCPYGGSTAPDAVYKFTPAADPIPDACGGGGTPWPILGDMLSRTGP